MAQEPIVQPVRSRARGRTRGRYSHGIRAESARRRDRERDAVRDAARRVPRRVARPPLVLERDRDEGARRRGPVRGSSARRARSAPAHARATRHGDRARRRSSCTRPSRSCARPPAQLLATITGDSADLVPAFTVPLPNRDHRAHARPRSRPTPISSQAWAKGLMESTLPGDEPHRTRRRIRRRVSRVRGLHRRPHRSARRADRRGYRTRRRAGPAPADHRRRRATPPPPDPRARAQPDHRRVHHDEPAARQPAARDPLEPGDRARDSRRRRRARTARSRRACGSRRRSSSWRAAASATSRSAGCPVSAGTRVITGFASANRDERVFEDPDDVPRRPPELRASPLVRVRPARVPRRVAGPRSRLPSESGRSSITSPPGTVRLAPDFEFENVPTYFERGPRRLPDSPVVGHDERVRDCRAVTRYSACGGPSRCSNPNAPRCA